MKYLHSPLTFVFCCLLVNGANAQPATKVGAICITVNKMDVSLPFYTKVLGFEHLSSEAFLGKDHENLMNNFGIHYEVAHLKLGDEYVDLVDYLTAGGRSIPETQKSNDLSFQHIAIVVSDMPKAYKLLKEKNVNFVSTEPQTIPISNPAAAGIKAFYFQDPDRHTLELIFFPAGKGKTKWHEKTSRLFLGIDHTAIGISNTVQSEAFWRDLLQLQKKGESHNYGTEQAHLNNVKDAELKITGLGANEGPGVEFLEYVKPGRGAQYPTDTRSDDLWNWITILYCSNFDLLYQKIVEKKFELVSEQIVTVNGKRNLIVRDPDGHAVWLIEN